MGKIKAIWTDVIKLMIWPYKAEHEECIKQAMHDQTLHKWTYYGSNIKTKDYAKRYFFLNKTLKYRILLPAMNFLNIIKAGKLCEMADVKGPQDKELRAFERAWNKAEKEWIKIYLTQLDQDHDVTETDIINYRKQRPVKTINAIKDFIMMLPLNDSAYHTFMDMLLLNIAKEVGQEHRHGTAKYPLYNFNVIDEIHYYNIRKAIEMRTAFIYDPESRILQNVPKDWKKPKKVNE